MPDYWLLTQCCFEFALHVIMSMFPLSLSPSVILEELASHINTQLSASNVIQGDDKIKSISSHFYWSHTP